MNFVECSNLQDIITVQDELTTASRLVDGVRYYYTSDSDVFNVLCRDQGYRGNLVFVEKEANNHKFTFCSMCLSICHLGFKISLHSYDI
jgi:hypothetical protein